MPRARPQFPDEFKRQMVELVRSGRTAESHARKFEPCAGILRLNVPGPGSA